MVKKYHKEKQAWLEYFVYLFRNHQADLAKNMLDRSFSSLPVADRKPFVSDRFVFDRSL
jgi:hypothetical protein